MTTQDFYNRNYISDNEADTLILMQEYARLKCKELLQIVAEKAKIIESKNFGWKKVDKESILNAVDLDSFCS